MNNCVITPACKLKGVLHEAMAAYFKVLDSYTLADFVENNEGLRAILLVATEYFSDKIYDKMIIL